MAKKIASKAGGLVLFVCARFTELNLVMKSEAIKVAGAGRSVPDRGRAVTFRKMPFRGHFRGEYLTKDPAEIKFLREHDYNGTVIFEEAIPGNKDRAPVEGRVTQGVASTGRQAPVDPEIEAPAPEDARKGPRKARIAAALKRKQEAAAA